VLIGVSDQGVADGYDALAAVAIILLLTVIVGAAEGLGRILWNSVQWLGRRVRFPPTAGRRGAP
jgi:hypothetical protein